MGLQCCPAVTLHFPTPLYLPSVRWLFHTFSSLLKIQTPPSLSSADDLPSRLTEVKQESLKKNFHEFYHLIYLPACICTYIAHFPSYEYVWTICASKASPSVNVLGAILLKDLITACILFRIISFPSSV